MGNSSKRTSNYIAKAPEERGTACIVANRPVYNLGRGYYTLALSVVSTHSFIITGAIIEAFGSLRDRQVGSILETYLLIICSLLLSLAQ